MSRSRERTYIMMLLDCILLRQAIVDQVPILVQFDDEEGVDFGGVCRDFFSGFWEEAYQLVMLALYQTLHCPWSDFVTWLSLLWISSFTHMLSCACFDIVGVVNQHFTRDICEIFLGIF